MPPRKASKSTVKVSPRGDKPTVSDAASLPASGETHTLADRYQGIIRGAGVRNPVPYEFVGKLGSGRQGHVFLALRRGARGCITRHAIKVFDPAIYESAEQYWSDMGRIATQISTLQTTHNPYLLRRDTYDEEDGVGYVQMEEIDGIDLADLLNRERMLRTLGHLPGEERDRFSETLFRVNDEGIAIQPGVAVYILRQILRGLEALHNKGFVHSDIKPSNVMVDRLGLPRVIDHGRATRSGEDTGILLGSPVYMAPECHDREPAVVQSDLYSAGIVGLEMLTGEPLVKQTEEIRESQIVLIKSNLTQKLESLLPDYVLENETLSNVIFGLLQPDPMHRFASVDDVESGVSGLPVIHRQLVQIGKDMEYDRELRDFLSYLVDPKSDRIRRDRFEMPRT